MENKKHRKRPKRRVYTNESSTPKFSSQPDARNKLTRFELRSWMQHQQGVIQQLEDLLAREKERLEEVQQIFGNQAEAFDPDLIYRKIRSIGRLHGAAQSFSSGYDQKWTWKQKIMYIVNFQRYPMRLRDIVRAFRYLDAEADLIRNLDNTISVNLRLLKQSGQLVHYKPPGKRSGSYVHPSWLDEKGGLKAEYSQSSTE